MYEIEFTEKADTFFSKLEKSMQERIGGVLERIKFRPQDFIEKLVGETGYKLRVGDYRLFLDINNQKLLITVIEISHRRNIYKR